MVQGRHMKDLNQGRGSRTDQGGVPSQWGKSDGMWKEREVLRTTCRFPAWERERDGPILE